MDPPRWRPIFACFLSTVVSSGLLVVSTHMIIYLPNSWDKLAVKFKGWLAAVSLIHISQWIPSHISFLNRRDWTQQYLPIYSVSSAGPVM